MNFLERIVREDFHSYVRDTDEVSFIIYSNRGTSTALVFAENRFWPIGVLRISTSRDHVTREYNLLRVIVENADPHFTQTVPQPICIHRVRERVVSSQPFIRMERMKVSRTPISMMRRVQSHLRDVRVWLSNLAKVPIPNHISKGVRVCESVEAIQSGGSSEAPGLSTKILRSMEVLQKFPIPLVVNHRDLYVDNILWNKGKLCVIDWEYACIAWPLFDWFFFVCDYALHLFSKNGMEATSIVKAFNRAFVDRTWFSEIVLEETRALCRSLSLYKRLASDFYVLGVADFLYRRLRYRLSAVEEFAFLFDEGKNVFSVH